MGKHAAAFYTQRTVFSKNTAFNGDMGTAGERESNGRRRKCCGTATAHLDNSTG